MSGCSGKCDSCGPIDRIGTLEAPKRQYIGKDDNSDIFDMVHPRAQKEEKVDLDGKCPHYEYIGAIPKSGCEDCISLFVKFSSDEVVEAKRQELLNLGKAVAARRVQLELEDKKWKRKIPEE